MKSRFYFSVKLSLFTLMAGFLCLSAKAEEKAKPKIWAEEITWSCSLKNKETERASDCISYAVGLFKRALCEYAFNPNDIQCNPKNDSWHCGVPAVALKSCYAISSKDSLKYSHRCMKNDADLMKDIAENKSESSVIKSIAGSFNVTLCRKVEGSSLKSLTNEPQHEKNKLNGTLFR